MATYKSSGVLDVIYSADKYIEFFRRNNSCTSALYSAEEFTFQIESKDLETGTVNLSIVGSHIPKSYNTVKATVTVTPAEDMRTSRIAWILKAEKISNDIADPEWIANHLVFFIRSIDLD